MEDLYSLDAESLARRLIDAVGANTWPPVHDAVTLVQERHAGQKRKCGGDFVCHPLRVALLLLEVGEQKGADVLCAGLLHDIVEDTETQLGEIGERFGGKVEDLVHSLTLPELAEGQSKFDLNMKHFKTLRWADRDAQIIKSADRLDNLLTLSSGFSKQRRQEYLRESREGLLPLTLAVNTALYHALEDAIAKHEAA